MQRPASSAFLAVVALVFLCQCVTTAQGKNHAPEIWVGRMYAVNFGETFDQWREVRAYDREDGDLTMNITVTGAVRPLDEQGRAPPQVFRVFYDVADSEGARAVTVKRTCHCNSDDYFLCKCYGPLQDESTGTQQFHETVAGSSAQRENTNSLCVPTTDKNTQQYSCINADTPELDLKWSLHQNKLDDSFYVDVGKGH